MSTDETTLKRCAGPCYLDKPLDQFRRRTASRDGHDSWCKTCRRNHERQHRRGWREPTPEDIRREGFAAGVRAAQKHLAAVDDDTLKAAVALTHPDRHPPEREAEATRVTALLLKARKGIR